MSLALRDLSFGYRGGGRLFDGLAIEDLAPGALTAVVGPNGVGKSSLFRLIAGLLRPATGQVTLGGVDLATLPHRTRNSRVFFLSQHTAIRAALCVFEVVLLARKSGQGSKARPDDIARVEQVLAALNIDGLSDRPVTDLSGGQQQLVAAAQALVRDPEVLLLDEPTSALDLRRQLEVMELVRSVARQRGIVVLLALHDLGLAGRYADRFILLDSGRVVADGSPQEVLSSAELENAYGVGIRVERTSRGGLVVDPYLRDGGASADGRLN